MTPIPAKPTTFQGTNYRSRLEARWSVFLTALGVKWKYEPLSFDLDGWTYTPDFLLIPRTLLEVKPCMPNEEVLESLAGIPEATDYFLLLGYGNFFGSRAPLVLNLDTGRTETLLRYFSFTGFHHSQKKVQTAIKKAIQYRFDLRQP